MTETNTLKNLQILAESLAKDLQDLNTISKLKTRDYLEIIDKHDGSNIPPVTVIGKEKDSLLQTLQERLLANIKKTREEIHAQEV
jgi:hypothetical protein